VLKFLLVFLISYSFVFIMIRNLFRLMFILIIISESLCSVTLLGICTYISANNISHCLQCSLSNKQPPLWLTTSHHHHVTITYHLYSFPPHCSWLEHSSWSGHQGLFLWSIQGYDSQITQYVSWSRPYHEEPLLSCFLLLSFVASLVCFCCSLHNTIDYVTRLLLARSLQYIEAES